MVFRTPQTEVHVYRPKILLITRILIRPEQQAFAKTPRPKPPAPEPGPEPSPAMGYLPMTLKRRIETQRAGLPGGGADGPLSPGCLQYPPQPTE
jgi:hypothetical protein